jgi:mannose-6-phosphate isomerase-like protein (cupin superfamily)
MFIKHTQDCPAHIAIDGCTIREILQPARDALELPYSLAIAEVAVGARTYRHRLQHTEVYYLLTGRGLMHIENETTDVIAGDAITIPARAAQWIENSGHEVLRFIALVSPPWTIEADQRCVD